MKKMLSITLLAVAMAGFSNIALASCCDPCCPPPPKPQCEPCKECEICPPCEPCKPCCTEVPAIGEPCRCAYNAPARIDPACGWDAWISTTFLYWQPKEKGLEVGYFHSGSATEHVYIDNPINMEFDYHPAFKLGLGFSSERDDWTLFFEYTRFYSQDCRSFDIEDTVSSSIYLASPWICENIIGIASNLVGGGACSYLSGNWKLKTNLVDVEMGRPFYLGKKLIFKPHFGLRGGSIDQKYSSRAKVVNLTDKSIFVDLYSSNKVDSWLIGPRAGVDTEWLVACKFRVFGNVAGSLCYQKFKPKASHELPQQDLVNEANELEHKGKDSIAYLAPNAELELGLGWGTYFCNNEWYFDLSAGYSFNYFWEQNMFRHLMDGIGDNFDGDAGDLMLHGLTITARLDF